MAMSDAEPLICAFMLNREGGGTALGWQDIAAIPEGGGILWVHLHRESPEARAWLTDVAKLPELAIEALLAAESRPRATAFDDRLLLDLRGVNLNPGADPEDMVGIRGWIDGDRIVTVRRRKLMAVDDLRSAIERGRGPRTAAGFIIMLAQNLLTRMQSVIGEIDDRVDALEDEVLTAQSAELRRSLAELRRQAIALRRYIGPNREALARLLTEPPPWIEDRHRMQLREVSDRITRHIEDLDSARDRAAVVQDELASRISETMNRNTYVLSLIAGIFLPLSLLTGLLGINVAGIPGEKWPWAFLTVCAILGVLGALQVWLLRRRRWF
jgi:zinc transporter